MTAFQYFEIRACVEQDGDVTSFVGIPEYNEAIGDNVCSPASSGVEAEAFRAEHGITTPVFWTLYGRDADGLALAVGDFMTYADADEVMNAILAPMAAARDALDHQIGDAAGTLATKANAASAILEDFINQCTNSDRI